MGEAKIVTIEELTTNNPTLCLSANRVFGRCNECEYYKRKTKEGKPLKCVPIIDDKRQKVLEAKKKLTEMYKDNMKKLDEMLKGC